MTLTHISAPVPSIAPSPWPALRCQHSGRNLSAGHHQRSRGDHAARADYRPSRTVAWLAIRSLRPDVDAVITHRYTVAPGPSSPGMPGGACNTPHPQALAPRARRRRIVAAQHGIEPDRRPSLMVVTSPIRVAVGATNAGIDPGRSARKKTAASFRYMPVVHMPWPDSAVAALTGEKNCNVF